MHQVWKRIKRIAGVAVVIAAVSRGSIALADTPLLSFTPGNFVVLRGGDSTNPNSTTNEVASYLDEYSVSVAGSSATATYVGTLSIPADSMTLPNSTSQSHEGRLNLSTDGNWLTWGGYGTAVGGTARPTNGSATQVIGRVSGNALSLDTSTQLTPANFPGGTTPQFIRGLYSNDGNEFWDAGKSPNGGLAYVSGTGAGAGKTLLQSTTDWRNVKIYNNQLYGGTGSSSVGTHGFYAIAPGQPAPTSGSPSNLLLTNNSDNSISDFSMLSMAAGAGYQSIDGAGGPNVMYGIGDPSGNNFIGKLYSPSGSTPLTANNLLFAGGARLSLAGLPTPEGVLAKFDPNNPSWVDLYITTASGVYFGIDTSGSPTGSIAGMTLTKIIDPGANSGFYGLAPSPAPEPATLALLGLGALAMIRRRR
ncbi:MAG TPA: PEP-CTERM sorting domain-containing protein [Phycisphaerae bacterium]|nr:PEP-CTERM sorting domain-containing protein [Phycisphaerae bacterium]